MVENMEVTSISIYLVNNSAGKLRAIARVCLNDCLQLTSVRVYQGQKDLFVAYPIEHAGTENEFRQIFYPVRRTLREYLEYEIVKKYKEMIKDYSK